MQNLPALIVRKVHPEAQLPQRKTNGAAGYDLFSVERVTIPPGKRALISTGLQMEIPPGHCGRIVSRSSMALNHAADVQAGIIDEDYRGTVQVLLANNSENDFVVPSGERIAQLLIQPVSYPRVTEAAFLSFTARGEGGFGSTGRR